eukprot:TRINITY_DN9199_c0_g1_i6.p1 TRINITY_DN9199_c0_g1~~TRINITY_DN9199_c0_g1_i6.p1  ORF type:complete len:637 (-),score=123.83 TRINITY_DN9199_c0_g1_i6:371-2281(-)
MNNLDWFGHMEFLTFLRQIGRFARVGTMIAKDSVKSRLEATDGGMSFTEFTYQLLQGYDFVHLSKNHDVQVQIGGSDQWGNITAGTDLNRRILGEEAKDCFGLTFPLLLDSEGKKFGKSEGGAIWLSADKLSPYKFYQYLFKTSDEDVIRFLKMLTFLPLKEVQQIEEQMKSSNYVPNTAQKILAQEVTRYVHGEEALQQAIKTTYNSPEVALTPLSPKCREIFHRLKLFMHEKIFPIEKEIEAHCLSSQRWQIHPKMEDLKLEAKKQGLWNLWVPADMSRNIEKLVRRCISEEEEIQLLLGPRLKTTEYAVLAECMGSCLYASEIFNCSAPDTGNMEVLARFGSQQQQEKWLIPLLRGDIRSCFAMTEKKVASSDATNISTKLTKVPNGYAVDGLKWWISGAMDPRCELCILLARNNWLVDSKDGDKHSQHTMVLLPMKSAGVRIVRAMEVFGYDDAPHGHAEIELTDVRIPVENVVLGEGRGFEVAQGRLGPGRIHHCMRAIGMGERAMSLMVARSQQRIAFGQPLYRYNSKVIGNCRIDLDMARLLVLEAAATIDRQGAKLARLRIAEAKVKVPRLILGVIDAAIQMHGGEGVSQDTHLARLWAVCRTLRLADGPDDVHLDSIGKLEVKMAKL